MMKRTINATFAIVGTGIMGASVLYTLIWIVGEAVEHFTQ